MIDIKQYIVALKWVSRLIDESYTANWKLDENVGYVSGKITFSLFYALILELIML